MSFRWPIQILLTMTGFQWKNRSIFDADFSFSSWVNHTMHTFVIFLVVFELFTVPREYPSRKQSLIGLILGNWAIIEILKNPI